MIPKKYCKKSVNMPIIAIILLVISISLVVGVIALTKHIYSGSSKKIVSGTNEILNTNFTISNDSK